MLKKTLLFSNPYRLSSDSVFVKFNIKYDFRKKLHISHL